MDNINKQTEANKRWQEKNKEKAKYLSDRSRAKSFIKNKAELKDLGEIGCISLDQIEKFITEKANIEEIQKIKIAKIFILELIAKYIEQEDTKEIKKYTNEEDQKYIINYIKEHPEEDNFYLLKILNELRENK